MFEVTSCNQDTGVITVEDIDFGLKYEFNCLDVRGAEVRDEYDLHVTINDGTSKVIRILD
ncbi:MAG: hypothetical protein NTW57_05110 [Methylophilales bacterium]|nr:hypothetical protein [Methylophilales bacterium]